VPLRQEADARVALARVLGVNLRQMNGNNGWSRPWAATYGSSRCAVSQLSRLSENSEPAAYTMQPLPRIIECIFFMHRVFR
jgi:hypothetical protein